MWTVIGVALFVAVLVVVRDHRRLAALHLHRDGRRPRAAARSPRCCRPATARSTARGSGSGSAASRSSRARSPRSLLDGVLRRATWSRKRDVLASPAAGSSASTCRAPATSARSSSPGARRLLILVRESDLGSSLLFFGIFLVDALRRHRAQVVAAHRAGAVRRRRVHRRPPSFGHVHDRFDIWLHPFATHLQPQVGGSYQLVQGLFGMATGGIIGTGLGQGRPDIVPFAKTDFIMSTRRRGARPRRRDGDPDALPPDRRARAARRRRPAATRSASCSRAGSRSASRCRCSSWSAASPG